jgi:protein phosphatase methylesterase 1
VPSIITKSASPTAAYKYTWRTPLRTTAPYWEGWFIGLSSKFLTVRAARLLVLAGTDRLDKELMIGQMQGKFQMEVVPDVGHMLHEVRIHVLDCHGIVLTSHKDNPHRIGEILVEFWRRNERVVIGVKKVGEL